MKFIPFICANLDNSTVILFVAILFIVSIILLILLIKSIKRQKNNWEDFKGTNGILNVNQFEDFIMKKIQQKRSYFTLFQIDICDNTSLIKSYGKVQYQNAIDILKNNIKLLMNDAKITQKDEEKIYIYLKSRLNLTNINQLCQLLLLETQKNISIAGALKIDFDVNIGVISYPDCGKDIDTLKQNLALTLVAAKRKGINQYATYDISLSNKETQEYKSYIEIKNAIENKEFTLFYQPMVDIYNMEVFAAESLLRWNHKEKGVLPPSQFLDIMEHTGDINWVGFWAMEQLIKQSLQWSKQYPDRKLMLSMNLSPKQLINPQLADEMRRIVKKHKIDTREFCMEIVEFAVFDSVEEVAENIKKLRQMGFLIAVDNYGLEFSALNRLDDLSVDIIKLNRKFIKETQNNDMSKQIINMLINYAKQKNITIIAEGIENEEVLNYVKSLGIRYGQGFYFAKPEEPKKLMSQVILTPWAINK